MYIGLGGGTATGGFTGFGQTAVAAQPQQQPQSLLTRSVTCVTKHMIQIFIIVTFGMLQIHVTNTCYRSCATNCVL